MDPRDRLFGEIAVRLQLLTREQVNTCIQRQTAGDDMRVGEIAVKLGLIDSKEAELVGTHQQRILERRRSAQGEAQEVAAPRGAVEERPGRSDPRGEPGALRPRKPRDWEAATAPREAAHPPRADGSARDALAGLPQAPATPMELADTRPDPLPEEQPPQMAPADRFPGGAPRGAAGTPALASGRTKPRRARKANARWQAAEPAPPTARMAAQPALPSSSAGTMLGTAPEAIVAARNMHEAANRAGAAIAAAPAAPAAGVQEGGALPAARPPSPLPPRRAPAPQPAPDVDAFPIAEGDDRVDVGDLDAPRPAPAPAPGPMAAAPQTPRPAAQGGTMLGAAPGTAELAAAAAAAASQAAQAAGLDVANAERILGAAGGTVFGGFAGGAATPPAQPQPPPAAPVATPAAPAPVAPAPAAQPELMAPAAEPEPETSPGRVAAQRPASASSGNAADTYLGKALAMAMQQGASDLHAHSGAPIMLRIDGVLRALGGGPLARDAAEKVIAEIMTDGQWARLRERGEVDFAYTIAGLGRFRVNVYCQQRGLDVVFRLIPARPPSLEQLKLPARLASLTDHRTGMVLCTGPAGCGKSTTLAALLNMLVEKRPDHILTIEDPIEFVFPPGAALVNQRQIGDHTDSFERALRAALREDPDIIAITELRDRETMSLAISAAETGHLVLGTLHTGNAPQTINRIINAFPADEQEQIRVMLSESLRAVVSQRLVPVASGRGRVPALELMMVNTAVSNLIRDDKAHQLPSVMQTGKAAGMVTLDDSLGALVDSGTITKDVARRFAVRKERFGK